ncbi:MAG TPA: hypothetical protein ENK78_03585 [Thiothrix sp.]|nr:hypothetical protein [Thiothrix sp.]
MIEQTAIIVSVSKGYAWVKSSGQQCGQCSQQKQCGSQTIFSLFKKAEPPLQKVLNPVYAKPGDEVIVGLHSGDLLKTTVLAYLLPLINLIIFSLSGHALFNLLNLNTDLGALLFALFGLFIGLQASQVFINRFAKKQHFQPVILRTKTALVKPIHFSSSLT